MLQEEFAEFIKTEQVHHQEIKNKGRVHTLKFTKISIAKGDIKVID